MATLNTGFVPKVVGRPCGALRPSRTAMSSAYWLVAGRWSGIAVLNGPHTVAHWSRDVDIPGSSCRPGH